MPGSASDLAKVWNETFSNYITSLHNSTSWSECRFAADVKTHNSQLILLLLLLLSINNLPEHDQDTGNAHLLGSKQFLPVFSIHVQSRCIVRGLVLVKRWVCAGEVQINRLAWNKQGDMVDSKNSQTRPHAPAIGHRMMLVWCIERSNIMWGYIGRRCNWESIIGIVHRCVWPTPFCWLKQLLDLGSFFCLKQNTIIRRKKQGLLLHDIKARNTCSDHDCRRNFRVSLILSITRSCSFLALSFCISPSSSGTISLPGPTPIPLWRLSPWTKQYLQFRVFKLRIHNFSFLSFWILVGDNAHCSLPFGQKDLVLVQVGTSEVIQISIGSLLLLSKAPLQPSVVAFELLHERTESAQNDGDWICRKHLLRAACGCSVVKAVSQIALNI